MNESVTMTTFRFPTGKAEYGLSGREPRLGEVLKRNGDSWVVVEVATAYDGAVVVTLREASDAERA